MDELTLRQLLENALQARADLLDPDYGSALRLFNGFYEGCPELVVDLFADTLVIYTYAGAPDAALTAQAAYLSSLPGIQCVLLKERTSPDPERRRGRVVHGGQPAVHITENGVTYAIDLQMNQDASFYPDTRLLRTWARQNLAGKSVLNTFAYTGSLGVAARAGGASQVTHLDRSARFLELAKRSYALNGSPVDESDFISDDIFTTASRLRRRQTVFDCVFIDPPYFSATTKGRVDLLQQHARLLNKVRPLVADGGWLVAINNALFLSGLDYLASLQALCADGYLSIETLIAVPPDITGYPQTIQRTPPADPAPFNHPTKIAILRARRK